MTIELNDSRPGVSPPPVIPDDFDDLLEDEASNEGFIDLFRRKRGQGGDWLKTKLAGSPTARPKRAVSSDSPIRAVDGCLFYGIDGYWYASFVLDTIPMFSNMSRLQQFQFGIRLAHLLSNLEGKKGVIRVSSEELDVEWMEEFWKNESILAFDDLEGQKALFNKIRYDTAALADEEYRLKRFTIEIALDDRSLAGSLKDFNREQYDRGVAEFGMHRTRNWRLVEQVQNLLDTIMGDFKTARPLSQREVLHIINQSTWRGAPSLPPLTFSSQRPVVHGDALAYLGESNHLDLVYELEVDQGGDKGYVSYLTLAVLPDDIPTVGLEYLWLNDLQGDPLDVIIHFEVQTPEQINEEMDTQQARTNDYAEALWEHNGEAGQEEVQETRDHIARFKDYAKKNRPAVRYTVTAAITGRTRRDVSRLRKAVIQTAANPLNEDDAMTWTAPNGLQIDLHRKCIPGSDIKPDRYWHDAEPHAIAAGAPNATDIPSIMGAWMGRLTGHDRGPLLISLESTLTEGIDAGTVTVLLGPPGVGKTTLALELGVNQARKGTQVFFREGQKGDTLLFDIANVPFAPRAHLMDISEEPGCFNPGLFGADIGEQANSLTDFLAANAPFWDKTWRPSVYTFASEEVKAHPHDPDFRRIVAAMAKDKKYRMMSDSWTAVADLSEANIAYGSRDQFDQLVDRLKSGLNVWRNVRWRLPNEDTKPEDWTTLERFSVSAMTLQFGFSRTVALTRDRRTFTVDDEFHERAHLAGGVGVSDFNLHGRWGRAKGAMYLIATHSGRATDIPPQLKQFATHVIAFRPADEDEARLYAEMLRVPKDGIEQIVQDLLELGCDPDTGLPVKELKGEAMTRYPNGQIARGQYTRREVGTTFRTTFTPSSNVSRKG